MSMYSNKSRSALIREKKRLLKELDEFMEMGADDPGDITPSLLEIDRLLEGMSKIQNKNKKFMV